MARCSLTPINARVLRARKEWVMSGKVDKAKGRVKEAAGALTGDRRLKREGKLDQAAGGVKDAAERAKDAAERAVDRVKDSLRH
jgi:uncharacterized protein YjbJ (UPF0337 family)